MVDSTAQLPTESPNPDRDIVVKCMPLQYQPRTLNEKLSGTIGIVLSLLLIAGGFWARSSIVTERASFIEVEGTVVDTVSRRERNSSDKSEKEVYAPVIEFVVGKDRVRFTGRYQTFREVEGRTVRVRYDPQHPEKSAKVPYDLEEWTHWGMFALGGFSLVYNAGLLLPIRWSSSKERE